MLLELTLILTFAAHLLAVNLAVGGPVIAMLLDWWRGRESGGQAADTAGRWMLGQSILAIPFAAMLGGVAVGLLWQLAPQAYFSAAAKIPLGRYLFGALELLFSVACLSGYWAWWPGGSAGGSKWRIWTGRALALLGATNLIYHFPTLFSVIAVISTRPELADGEFRFLTLLLHPETLARATHFLLASLAVSGTVLMVYCVKTAPLPSHETTPEINNAEIYTATRQLAATDPWYRLALRGAWIALVPTLLQLIVGLWVLLQLPYDSRERLLGQDMLSCGVFAAALGASFWLMHRLTTAVLGELDGRSVRNTALLMVVVVVLMVAARHLARRGTFERIEADAAVAMKT